MLLILLAVILLALAYPRVVIATLGLCVQLALLWLGIGVLLGMLHPR